MVNGSISETAPLVAESVDFVTDCPFNLRGSPLITWHTKISRRINSAADGFNKRDSKSIIFGFTPYKTLNNILKDSSVPFDW